MDFLAQAPLGTARRLQLAFEPPQVALGAPLFRQFNRRLAEIAIPCLELHLELAEQGQRIGDGAGVFDGVELPGLGGGRARISATSPFGLEGEPGSLPGVVGVLLQEPASEDACFGVAAVDPGTVVIPDRPLVVAAGSRWYRWHCERAGVEPAARFRALLREYAGGVLHGPFNVDARLAAGFDAEELAGLEAEALTAS